jgi:hypothetical protein
VTVAQRRARLLARHRLGVPAGSVADATESLVALHATDPLTVYLSAWARTRCTIEAVDAALYADRTLVRMLGMRRTVFLVPARLAGLVQAACTDDVARRLRRQLEKDLAGGMVGNGDPASWLRSVEDGVLRSLAGRGGGASGAELSRDEPRLRTQLVYAAGKAYGGAQNITSRVLVLIAADGRMIRGNRRGGWSSGQFEWVLPDAWLGRADSDPDGSWGARPDPAAARAELARRWLAAFGPALPGDLQWWAGWTGAQTKAALAQIDAVEVDLDGRTGVLLAGDDGFPAALPPAAALLPALDPTPMGWQERSWYMGPHVPFLFDRTGNVGPTVWWEGRVVGGWAQRASGEVVFRLLEDIGAAGVAAVGREAERLETWLGQARVTPRFRVPLERELSA